VQDHLCLYRPPKARCEITCENRDITDPGENAGLLIISAFPGSYVPSSGSVVGALDRKGIDWARVLSTARWPHRDCWICELDAEDARIAGAGRILCYEGEVSLDRLQILFSVLLTQIPHPGSQSPWSIHLPLLGAGDQGGDPRDTLRWLVGGFQEAFANGLNVQSIRIFTKDREKFEDTRGTFRRLRDEYNPFTAEVDLPLKHKLFISYSHKDADLVQDAYRNVRAEIGPDHFIDIDADAGVKPGTILSRDLARAVRQSRAMLAVISEPYVTSPYCRLEYATAYTRYFLPRRDRHYPFLLRPVFLPPGPGSLSNEYRDVMGHTCKTRSVQELSQVMRDLVKEIDRADADLKPDPWPLPCGRRHCADRI
jgi:hypothetical protein